jgi:hypothetical protein
MSLLRWIVGLSGLAGAPPPAIGVYFPITYFCDGMFAPSYFTRPFALTAPAFSIAIALDTNSWVGLPRSTA